MLPQLLANGLLAGSSIALAAVAFTMLFNGGKFFAFTFGATYTWSAYAFLAVSPWVRWPTALAASLCVGSGLGVLLERFLFRPIRARTERPLPLMLASIGAYTVLQNVVSLVFGDTTRSIPRRGAATVLAIGTARITTYQAWSSICALCAVLGVWWFLRLSPLGMQMRAVASNRDLALIAGVNVNRIILIAAAMSSTLSGLAGILVSMDTDLAPTMGFQALLLAVTAAIVGGIGTISGAVLGGLFLGIARQLAVWKLPTQWQDGIVFVILILFLLFRPQGVLGRPYSEAA